MQIKEFLIVKTSSIGDVIQCFHLVEYLRRHFPGCKIDWVVEKEIAPLMRAHPELERILEIHTKLWRKNPCMYHKEIIFFLKELRKKNYTALFDLQGNIKSGFVTGFAKAKKKVGFSWKNLAEKPNFFATNVHFAISHKNIRNQYLQMLQDFFGDKEDIEIYRNDLKNQEFGKEDAQNFLSEQTIIAERQGAEEDENSEFKLMQPKIDPSSHFGIKPLKLLLKQEEEIRLERLGQLCFQRPRFMICFGSNWKNKMLSEKTLIEFLHKIDEKLAPSFFFIYGNQKEKEIADRLERVFSRCSHSVGEMSLPLWQRFMYLVEGVISIDSAALHLCATTKTPSFSLFGPSSSEVYKPTGEKHVTFQGTCPYEVHFEKRCPFLRTCETGACLREVPLNTLFEQFEVFWEKISDKQLMFC